MILSNLKATKDQLISNLLDSLKPQCGEDEATIRAKITQLLVERKIELTRSRRLRVRSVTTPQDKIDEESHDQRAVIKCKTAGAGA
jgi:hypothetical protein